MGDLTRDHLQLFSKENQGLEKQYNLADLLLVDPNSIDDPVARTETKPHAQNDPRIPNSELPAGQYGSHQYSNMGYMIAGLAVEYRTEQALHALHINTFFTQQEVGPLKKN